MQHDNFQSLISQFADCCEKSKVASENGKRFEIISKEIFTKLKIDGCLIKSQQTEKCDFGFIRHSNNDFYFVELKGKDIQKAYNQIVSAIAELENNLIIVPKNKRFGFIVSSKVPKAGIDINNLKQDFLKNYGKKLEVKNKILFYVPV
jgi:uncharacterized protein YjbI with pentapeptide repeats